MTIDAFNNLKSEVLSDLDEKLDPRLAYHCRKHTEDVLFHTERIALAENIKDARLLLLMKVAALFHDTGFKMVYKDHEKKSCEIMTDVLKDYDFDQPEMELMRKMIMATKVPQSPAAIQEMVICDADLDYLGRDDFDEISGRLRNEMLAYEFIKTDKEWYDLQVNFLTKHRYFTNSSVILREPIKHRHLSALMKALIL